MRPISYARRVARLLDGTPLLVPARRAWSGSAAVPPVYANAPSPAHLETAMPDLTIGESPAETTPKRPAAVVWPHPSERPVLSRATGKPSRSPAAPILSLPGQPPTAMERPEVDRATIAEPASRATNTPHEIASPVRRTVDSPAASPPEVPSSAPLGENTNDRVTDAGIEPGLLARRAVVGEPLQQQAPFSAALLQKRAEERLPRVETRAGESRETFDARRARGSEGDASHALSTPIEARRASETTAVAAHMTSVRSEATVRSAEPVASATPVPSALAAVRAPSAEPSLRIGTIEVRLEPPPPARQAVVRSTTGERLSRGFISPLGLRQG